LPKTRTRQRKCLHTYNATSGGHIVTSSTLLIFLIPKGREDVQDLSFDELEAVSLTKTVGTSAGVEQCDFRGWIQPQGQTPVEGTLFLNREPVQLIGGGHDFREGTCAIG